MEVAPCHQDKCWSKALVIHRERKQCEGGTVVLRSLDLDPHVVDSIAVNSGGLVSEQHRGGDPLTISVIRFELLWGEKRWPTS